MREFRKASREIRATLEVEEVRRSVRQSFTDDLTGDKRPPETERTETERTGVGTVPWKEGKDDLAAKKRDLEKARRERLKQKPTSPNSDKANDKPNGNKEEDKEPTADLPESNAALNENKLDLTSPAKDAEEPVENANGGTRESPPKASNGQ